MYKIECICNSRFNLKKQIKGVCGKELSAFIIIYSYYSMFCFMPNIKVNWTIEMCAAF